MNEEVTGLVHDTGPRSFVCSGVRIDEFGPQAAASVLLESAYGVARRIHLCNAYTLSLAVRDRTYRELLNGSDLNFADGHYVAMVGRWRGHSTMDERVYGPALMLATLDLGRARGLRHYLYGASPETVSRLALALRDRFPGVDIVGVDAPPFRPLTPAEEADLLMRVSAAKPDVFWVGLGTPKQDRFVAEFADRLTCTVVPVGAAFDFHAGTKMSPPRIAQRFGLEWLFRLLAEPVRLWRRYLIGIPIFLVGVFADRVHTWCGATTATPYAIPRPRLETASEPERLSMDVD